MSTTTLNYNERGKQNKAVPGKLEKSPRSRQRLGDRVFYSLAFAAGLLILLILAAVTVFLFADAMPALTADAQTLSDSLGSNEVKSFWQYVAPFAFGTMWVAAIALLISTPISVGVALFISHYSPRKLAGPLGYFIDLLAAVPSVVYGLWGISFLAPTMQPIYAWLVDNLGRIPLFSGPVSGTGRTILTVGLVLAVMILPIMTAMCREVFLQTPRLQEEAALGLGATRWEMIHLAVLPTGKPGIVSAMMLGLGRALGETMAVAMVLSPSSIISFALLTTQNPNTIAANIALNFPEAFGLRVNTLIATGLVLFLITLLVNVIARWIISRRKEFSGANT